MATRLKVSTKPTSFTVRNLINKTRTLFNELPDVRKKKTANNLKYAISDAALSAFSVFFTQSPSFLDYQTRMQKKLGKNNAQSLFGIHPIPSTNQIRNLLDPVEPKTVYPLIKEINDGLYQNGYLKSLRSINSTLLLAIDGTDFFSSQKISCPCCHQQTLNNGKTLYRHSAITPAIVASGCSHVVPLPPEFITPPEGNDKQDGEITAAKRWLNTWGEHYSAWSITILGDDLYSHQPFFQEAIKHGFEVLAVCKPNSHPWWYEWIAGFERGGHLREIERTHWDGKQRLTEHYRYINRVPLRDGDDALMLNWCQVTITNAEGEVTYNNAWVTTHRIIDENVAKIVTAGRTGFQIENENNNVLKNKGYHFDHNFGHGKPHLSNWFATLIVLSFLLHTTLDWIDTAYHTVCHLLPSRRTFFEHLRALLQYIPFNSWEQMMRFMLEALDGETIPDLTKGT
jgi:hypothetical protein